MFAVHYNRNMEKLLRLRERVDMVIEIGKSHYREFKYAFAGGEVCAFNKK